MSKKSNSCQISKSSQSGQDLGSLAKEYACEVSTQLDSVRTSIPSNSLRSNVAFNAMSASKAISWQKETYKNYKRCTNRPFLVKYLSELTTLKKPSTCIKKQAVQ